MVDNNIIAIAAAVPARGNHHARFGSVNRLAGGGGNIQASVAPAAEILGYAFGCCRPVKMAAGGGGIFKDRAQIAVRRGRARRGRGLAGHRNAVRHDNFLADRDVRSIGQFIDF